MKVALVHDYLRDFGGAERVLKTLSEMYPEAPIYTAFLVEGSTAGREFADRKIIESKWAPLIKHWNLYSPLRFLLPLIWGGLDLSGYDLVITSCSNYIARGFRTSPQTKVVAYCHTPPRFLYGFQTGDLQKIWPVKLYAQILAFFLRKFDYQTAQKIKYWIANSQNVRERIKRFYQKEAVVIYPPIEVEKIKKIKAVKEDYFLIVSRIVGTKGILEAAQAAKSLGIKLKIAGEGAGMISITKRLKKLAGGNIELLGRVSDTELWQLYAKAKGFIALARDEDFGMTVVEAQAAGTPVVAFKGGGFKESVIENKTGIFVTDTDTETLREVFRKFNEIKWNREEIVKNADRFSKKRFIGEIKDYLDSI